MKKVSIGLLVVLVVLIVAAYFVANSGPAYDTNPQRAFTAQDPTAPGIAERSCFSKDCTRLLTLLIAAPGQKGKRVFFWDMDTEERLSSITPQLNGYQTAISPDNRNFALGGLSGVKPQVTIYEANTGKLATQLPTDPRSGAWEIAFLPDGETLVVLEGSPQVIAKVWNWKEEKELHSFPCRGFEMAVSADSKRIVTGGHFSRPKPGTPGMGGPGMGGAGAYGGGMGFSGNNNDDKARIWDVQTGKMLHELPNHVEGATSFAFNPDGAQVATGGAGASVVHVWDTQTGALAKSLDAFPGKERAVRSVAYSHDGTHLAVGYGPRPRQASTSQLTRLFNTLRGLLRTGGASMVDMTAPVVLWDCGTWQPVHSYGLNQISVTVAFLPEDKGLVTVDIQGMVRRWNLPG